MHFISQPWTQAKASRTELFNFTGIRIKGDYPFLKTTVDASTYGKPTQYFAHSLLQKCMENAEVYTGIPKLNECINACDMVINSGKFAIEPRTHILQNVLSNN